MEHDTYNELTAAYALDALDDDETKAYEEHLAGCAICQDNLAALSATMVQLAFAAPPVDPPPELRGADPRGRSGRASEPCPAVAETSSPRSPRTSCRSGRAAPGAPSARPSPRRSRSPPAS